MTPQDLPPLPEPEFSMAYFGYEGWNDWPSHQLSDLADDGIGTRTAFSADQMRSYALAAVEAARPKLTEPPPGLLMSMAIRFDHGLGVPGYYDQLAAMGLTVDARVTHKQRLESTIRQMRQLWEEVVGLGFYKPEKEADYAAIAALPAAPSQE